MSTQSPPRWTREHEPQQRAPRVPWRPVLAYIALAMGLSWLINLVFWFGGWESLFGLPPAMLAMLTPSLATLIVVLFVRRPRGIPRATALWPLRPVGRIAGYCLLAVIVPVALGILAPLVAAGVGAIDLDTENFSMLRQQLATVVPGFTGEGTGFPATAYLSWLGTLSVSFLTMLPFAFGEEWGWRGYLLPRLLPWGAWPALLVSGLIHGLWHAPILLLFSDFLTPSQIGPYFVMYVASVMAIGVIIGWLRLASGSVWPPVVAHTAQLAFMSIGFLTLADADTDTNLFIYPSGVGGVVGLAVLVAFAAFLGVTRQIRLRPDDPALSRQGHTAE